MARGTTTTGVNGPGTSTDRSVATWNGTGGNVLFDNSGVLIGSTGDYVSVVERVGDPGSVAGRGHVYVKDEGGIAELFFQTTPGKSSR